MSGALVTAVFAGAGLAVGVLLHRELADAAYRLDDECDRPVPRSGWLVPLAVALVWGGLAWRYAAAPRLAPMLLLGVAGVALARIDLDVHRLPEGLTLPAVLAVLALQVVVSAVAGDWSALGWALLAGVLSWAGLLLLRAMSQGALGWGDATLGGLVGLTLGYVEPAWAALALVAAFVLGGLVSAVGLLTRRLTWHSPIAFGPYLLLGALWVALLAPLSPSGQ
ncbi:MAG: prepilin peptidase [Dermatophilaceae bacterium]